MTLAVLLALAATQSLQPKTKALTPDAVITHPLVAENSGMVASNRYPGVVWVHNDSGDEARFWGIRTNGTVIVPDFLADRFSAKKEDGKEPYPGIRVGNAVNFDWEDIARLGDRLYLGDVGNNGNARRDLGVYEVLEPNPAAIDKTRPIAHYTIAYPDQTEYPGVVRWHFDCEAVFGHAGKLWFLTKHRAPGQIAVPETGTNLYRLDNPKPDQVNVLKKVDSAKDLGGWVTAADMSPDGKTLAVLCQAPQASIWLFTKPKNGDRWLSGEPKRLLLRNAKQAESLTWLDNRTLLLGNEQRELFRISTSEF
ncbi:MAG: hypothetical protein H3C58_05055 [Fimbriimonadaceae bacterium]|nr:hypothetical protein [Fimbriimonadaceae bacterium]